MNPLDYSVRSQLKPLVNKTLVENEENFRGRIFESSAINNTINKEKPSIFEGLNQSMLIRIDTYIKVGGDHFL